MKSADQTGHQNFPYTISGVIKGSVEVNLPVIWLFRSDKQEVFIGEVCLQRFVGRDGVRGQVIGDGLSLDGFLSDISSNSDSIHCHHES